MLEVADRARTAKTWAGTRLKQAARPIRLIAVGMLAAMVLTGIWMWHRARVDAAAATLVEVVPQAEQSLKEHDFVTAERLMGEAVAAIETLGATDLTARRIQQRHRELAAITQLAAQTPYDLAAEAEGFEANPDEWSERFAASYSDRWVIFDAPLGSAQAATPLGESAASGSEKVPPERVIPLEIPLTAGQHSVRFEVRADTFNRLESPARAIFAAQYDSWRLHEPEGEPPMWIVRFRPDTTFLWASTDIYEALGFDADDPADAARKQLDRQAKAIGLQSEAKPASGPKTASGS